MNKWNSTFTIEIEIRSQISDAANEIRPEFYKLREKCLYSEFFWSVFSRIPASLDPCASFFDLHCATFQSTTCICKSVYFFVRLDSL